MLNRLRKILFGPRISYQSLVEVRIFQDNILHNLHEFQRTYPKFKFAPVLKSNAYGHGLLKVAKILDREDIAFFMADSFYEALLLRRGGINSKILILGYATLEQINKSRQMKNVSLTIIDLQQLKSIAQSLAHPTHFHLKIDTGMHRQGILIRDLEEAVALIKSNSNIFLEGICSHLADADGADPSFTRAQIKTWNETVENLKQQFPTAEYFHLSNTAGTFFAPEIQANVGRVGIGLYGFNTSPFSKINLKPALEMASIITSIKTIPPGEKVGYNVTYTVPRDVKIATIPLGYNEGLDIRLSNKGFVKIKNRFCPIVGRISMNMCSIDITDAGEVKLEDEVIVISKDPADKNSIENIIKICNASRYEVPVHISESLRRVVI